jgi:hypothetical protein
MADENFNNFTGQQPDTNPAQNPQEWQNTTPVNDAQPSQNEQANFQAAQQPDFQQGGYQQPNYQQPNYQQPNYQQYNQAPNQQFYPPYQPPQEQKASVGLAILSFIIPIVGLILFITMKDKRPKTAKASGICALVSFILGIVFSIVFYAVGMMAAFTATDDLYDDYDSYYSDYYDYDDSYDTYDDTYYEYYG